MKNTFKTLLFAAAILSCLLMNQGNVFAAGIDSQNIAISSLAGEATPTGGCPAAALLGTDDPQLDTLRQFRDNVLAKSPAGRQLIKIYYATGSKIVAVLDNNPALKNSAKKALEAILPAVDIAVGK